MSIQPPDDVLSSLHGGHVSVPDPMYSLKNGPCLWGKRGYRTEGIIWWRLIHNVSMYAQIPIHIWKVICQNIKGDYFWLMEFLLPYNFVYYLNSFFFTKKDPSSCKIKTKSRTWIPVDSSFWLWRVALAGVRELFSRWRMGFSTAPEPGCWCAWKLAPHCFEAICACGFLSS